MMQIPTVVASLAALLALPCGASPFDGVSRALSRRDVVVNNACDTLVYGATKVPFGTVCVDISDGTLNVDYSLDAGWTVNEVHFIVGTSPPTVTSPGQMPYGSHKGSCTVSAGHASCSVPVQDAWRVCEKLLYIATHVAATSASGAAETGWGAGTCYDSKGNCAKYWTFTTHCQCPVVYEYKPATTTSTVTITTTSEIVYTVTFPDETKTIDCDDPKKPTATQHITTTKPIPADWTPPAKAK